jgi:hypothetical protein
MRLRTTAQAKELQVFVNVSPELIAEVIEPSKGRFARN